MAELTGIKRVEQAIDTVAKGIAEAEEVRQEHLGEHTNKKMVVVCITDLRELHIAAQRYVRDYKIKISA